MMNRAKKHLQTLYRYEQRIARLNEQKRSLYDSYGFGSVDYSKDRVRSSPESDASFTRTVEKIADVEIKIDRLVDQLIDERETIIGQLEGLDNETFKELLYLRYVKYERFEKIATSMNYTYQWIRRLHGFALEEFERKYLRGKMTEVEHE